MFGIAFGTMCLLGLAALAGGPRWGHHHHHHHHRRWRHHHHQPREGGGFARHVLRSKLDLDDDQEELVDRAVRDALKAASGFKDVLRDSRDELADAVKGDKVDDARLDAVFERWDESLAEARRDVVDALRKVHAALEPEQRQKLARAIAAGATRWV